jgi:hypothetical protein
MTRLGYSFRILIIQEYPLGITINRQEKTQKKKDALFHPSKI